MRRDWTSYAVLLLALVGLSLLAWMTRQPEAPLFVRAEGWPLIGETVTRIRRAYLPTAETGSPSGALSAESRQLRTIYIGIGALIRERPETSAKILEKTRNLSSYEVVGEDDRWIEVRRLDRAEGETGWYDPQASRDRTPPLGDDPEPVRPIASRPASEEQLAAVRADMGPQAWQGELAHYRLLTDVLPGAWLVELERRIEVAERLYRDRYGVAPIGSARETVVLFSQESAYRRYERGVEGLLAPRSTGHASGGAIVLYRGERSLHDLVTTLVHEIGHLLNRRALGPALPPWLDEGLADELAHRAVPAALAADGDPYGGLRIEGESQVEFRGILASIKILRQALARGELPTLASLTSLDAGEFSYGERVSQSYAHSALWVSSLLEDPLPRRYAAGLRGYLNGIASGEPATPERLLGALGADWRELELAFRSFLIDEAAKAGVWPAQEAAPSP